jgi:acyl carrier protein
MKFRRLALSLTLALMAFSATVFAQEDPANSMSTITERVTKVIVDKLGVDESEVTAKAYFKDDLGADDLDLVELIMDFEKEFSISIPDFVAEDMVKVEDVIDYLESSI